MSTADRISAAWPDDLGSDEQKISVHHNAPFDTTDPYWEEKANICRIVGSHPEGRGIQQLLEDQHGPEELADHRDHGPSAAYQRIRRFVLRFEEGNEETADLFRVEQSSGGSHVMPTLELISLIFGGITQNPTEKPYTPGREFAENLLRTVRPMWDDESESINWNLGSKQKWHLTKAFEDYVRRINDLRIIMSKQDPGVEAPQYISLPYKTRFNDSGRISKQQSIFNSCLEQAGETHETAVFVTLTTKPSHFRNLMESIEEINKNWNRLMSWLQTESRLGYRPEYVKVLEFQESGNPHIHAILFLEQPNDGSMPWLVKKSDLDDYWAKWQGGYINDIQPLVYDEDLGDDFRPDEGWIKWQPDQDHGGILAEKSRSSHEGGSQTAGEYLGKYLSVTMGACKELGNVGRMEMFEVSDGPDSEGRYADKAEPWKVAMYWATRRKIKTVSRSLRQAVEADHADDVDEELTDLIREARYRAIGAFAVDDIPMHIRSKLRTAAEVMTPPEDDEERLEPIGHETKQTDPPPTRWEDELVGI